MEKAKVYFTRDISSEGLMKIYEALSPELPGKVAVKVHSGETGNQNFLRPEFWKELIEKVGGTVTECNTAYNGTRNTTEKHLKTLEEHGWNKYFPVDLLDAEGPEICILAVPNLEIRCKYQARPLQIQLSAKIRR